jgi:hypothetical protein
MNRQYYKVAVRNHPSSFPRIIERECGHRHRSEEAAERCMEKRLGYDRRTNTWSAAWHRAEILDADTDRSRHYDY